MEKQNSPKVLVLYGYGINCDYETEYCFRAAGADAKRIHLSDLIERRRSLGDYHILALPGGFSFGDDISSSRVLANKLKYSLMDDILEFISEKKLIIGICNGFQAMVKMGLLPGFEKTYTKQTATITFNDSGRFEDRWVYLKFNQQSPCVFTKGMKSIYLPVRHGEGKFFAKKEVIEKLFESNQVVAQYTDGNGNPAGYPFNPNGSLENIAGICDPTGRVFGLMPHPEAYNHFTNHPRWTREKLPEEGAGMKIFRNAVEWVKRGF
jgi:phosphoribosylformylglycinamidine synthase